MEPVLTLSYYVQLREQIGSSVQFGRDAGLQYSSTPSLRTAGIEQIHQAPAADLSDVALAKSERQTPNAERQTHDLNDAFDAMVEEMKFDWPEFSPVDRIKTGLIESALGLLLFMALIAGAGFLHQYLIH